MNQVRLSELLADFLATPSNPGGDLSFLDMAGLCHLQLERNDELERLLATSPEFKPIDLSAFCDPNADDGLFPGTARPFQIAREPWLYATDGKISVRTPAAPANKPETAKCVPSSIIAQDWGGDGATTWEKWPELEWSTNLQRECHQCSDTGRRVDCKACLGSGRDFFQRVGEYRIQSHYDLMIRDLDLEDVCWRRATDTMIAFRFTGCEGLVMTLSYEKEDA